MSSQEHDGQLSIEGVRGAATCRPAVHPLANTVVFGTDRYVVVRPHARSRDLRGARYNSVPKAVPLRPPAAAAADSCAVQALDWLNAEERILQGHQVSPLEPMPGGPAKHRSPRSPGAPATARARQRRISCAGAGAEPRSMWHRRRRCRPCAFRRTAPFCTRPTGSRSARGTRTRGACSARGRSRPCRASRAPRTARARSCA